MSEAVNSFNNGLVMDFNPITTPNTVLTNCLNGTLITYNGNEYILQNDMGNGRVETAYLPQGYIPIGTTELGGIIYIVSYNPIINKSQIGCFPSPERNITTDEVSKNTIEVKDSNFKDGDNIVNTVVRLDLSANTKFNPGDKFLIYSDAISVESEEFGTKLSGFGNTNHNIEEDPKYVTIHVVSIGDNGEITYLDDSLKWFGNNYYIQERNDLLETVENEQKVTISKIDSYRNLLQSPYNIFNSKLSGKLALILELELIDTFTATYDVTEVPKETESTETTEETTNYKVSYNVTWTSRHNNINISYVQYTLNESETKTVNIENPIGSPTSENGASCNISINGSYSTSDKLNYTLSPCMPFGIIDFMKVSGTINFSEVGSGIVDLSQWRYYVEDTKMYLQWEMQVNPKPHWKVYEMSYIFIPYNKIDANFSNSTYSDLISKEYYTFNITRDNSYSGNYQKWIEFEEGKFEKGSLYLVGIFVKWGQSKNSLQYTPQWGWLYTNGQFNSIYYDSPNITNFNEIYLNSVLDIDLDLVSSKGLMTNTREIIGNIEGELTTGMEVIGVASQEVEYSPNVYVTYNGYKSSLFKVNNNISVTHQIADGENYFGNIKLINYKLEGDDDSSALLDSIKQRYEESYGHGIIHGNTSSSDTIEDRRSWETVNQDNINLDHENYYDYFRISNVNNQNTLTFNIEGGIFSRINADLQEAMISPKQIIRPLIKTTGDLANFNLMKPSSSEKFGIEMVRDRYAIGISQRNLGGNDPMAFAFSTIVRDTVRDADIVENFYVTSKDIWNPGDEPNYDKYWDIDPYNEVLNEWMKASGSPIVIVNYNYKKNGDSRFNDFSETQGIQYGPDTNNVYSGINFIGIWVKTDNYRYIPLNSIIFEGIDNNNKSWFGEAARQIVAALVQIYYVDEDPNTTINEIVVKNINRHKKYSEKWILNDTCHCTISNEDFYINNTKLVDLATYTQSLGVSNNNLQYSEESSTSKKISKTIEWKFNLDSSNLYEILKSRKTVNIQCVIDDSSQEGSIIDTKLYNSNYLYCFGDGTDGQQKQLYKVNSSLAKVITGEYILEDKGSKIIISSEHPSRPITKNIVSTALSQLMIKDGNICFSESGLLAPFTPVYYRQEYSTANKSRIAVKKGNSTLPLLS